jgi:hypothetical protein
MTIMKNPDDPRAALDHNVSQSQSPQRLWLGIAVLLSTLTALDLFVIIVEGITGESIINELPDSARCSIVNAAMSVPFLSEYKGNEEVVRARNHCPVTLD